MTPPYKSKALAAWLALLGGSLGLHRFYLHGLRDTWGWAHPLPTLIGAYGVRRVWQFGQDDHVSWALIPILGLTIAISMLCAIVYALTDDATWDRRFNPAGPPSRSGWPAVIAAILALMLGAGVLMATIAFSGQRFFEYEIEQSRKLSQ